MKKIQDKKHSFASFQLFDINVAKIRESPQHLVRYGMVSHVVLYVGNKKFEFQDSHLTKCD